MPARSSRQPRSGPAARPSLIAWDTLGRQGRNFVARGPTQAQIAGYRWHRPWCLSGCTRVCSRTTEQARADLLVRDLRRAGGFDR